MKCHFVICFLVLGLLHSINGHKQCPGNEVYKECHGCDQICNHEPIFCTFDCGEGGCSCEDGFVRAYEGGICIPETMCPTQCPRNEEFKECGGCDQTCGMEPIFCTQECNPGCYCKDGYVRSIEENRCIPESRCPTQCPRNEEFKECAGCDQICNHEPIVCTLECKAGCSCKDGFVRSEKGGRCIPESRCPSQCPAHQVYKKCGGCDQICNCEPIFCTEDCHPGCFCEDGYVRSREGGRCISDSRCKTQCPEHEVYLDCGGCDQVCNSEPIFCTQDCSYPGCYCKKGYVRAIEGGPCVLESRCPTQCPRNEEFKACGGCDQTCGMEPIFCTEDCNPGCYCKDGFVRSIEGDRCIPESECSECPENEEYTTCGSACPESCDHKSEVCPQVCVEGCFCKKGFIREQSTPSKCMRKELFRIHRG